MVELPTHGLAAEPAPVKELVGEAAGGLGTAVKAAPVIHTVSCQLPLRKSMFTRVKLNWYTGLEKVKVRAWPTPVALALKCWRNSLPVVTPPSPGKVPPPPVTRLSTRRLPDEVVGPPPMLVLAIPRVMPPPAA